MRLLLFVDQLLLDLLLYSIDLLCCFLFLLLFLLYHYYHSCILLFVLFHLKLLLVFLVLGFLLFLVLVVVCLFLFLSSLLCNLGPLVLYSRCLLRFQLFLLLMFPCLRCHSYILIYLLLHHLMLLLF